MPKWHAMASGDAETHGHGLYHRGHHGLAPHHKYYLAIADMLNRHNRDRLA
jgi:hypothetical protein